MPDYTDEVLDEGGERVRAIRMQDGTYRYQDPDRAILRTDAEGSRVIRNGFIAAEDGIARLQFNFDSGQLEDSFGTGVGVGALNMPKRGVTVDYVEASATYSPLGGNPESVRPDANQEIIERVYFVDRDGNIITLETSYGLGQIYDPTKSGGRWRRAASEALGLPENSRAPTSELKEAELNREFLIKEITTNE